MKDTRFHTATLKLTAWYLAVLLTVSISFSAIIYTLSAHELDRPLPAGIIRRIVDFEEGRMERAREAKQSLLTNLVILNLVTAGIGAAAAYAFARRTLKPIESAMEAQSQFTSDASHELRTPLAVMRMENEIALRDKKPTASSLKGVVKSNLEEIERLQLLTDRLLALSSEQTLLLAPFALGPVIDDAVARHEAATKQKKIRLEVIGNDATPLGHSETVGDILSILIDNAIKYSPEHTSIKITAAEHARKVTVEVTDEGIGIEGADRAKIFERFYRTDRSRSKQNVEGHGLGLALAKRLTDMNRAQLLVRNNPSKGSTFILELEKA